MYHVCVYIMYVFILRMCVYYVCLYITNVCILCMCVYHVCLYITNVCILCMFLDAVSCMYDVCVCNGRLRIHDTAVSCGMNQQSLCVIIS